MENNANLLNPEKEFDPMLPQFFTSSFYANKKVDTCSVSICENVQPEENVPYSDNIYGHLWFPKLRHRNQVKIRIDILYIVLKYKK